jgi:DNA-binding CsgD family transcriptional regulator
VAIKLKQSLAYVRGKRVLVTGAGGSIGSELCRQLLSGGVSRLYLLGHGENSIYQIDRELRLLQEAGVGEKANIVPVIGDLKDAKYVDYILAQLKADALFHTAAYKHVPMMEENPVAAIENNVIGTENLINAALKQAECGFPEEWLKTMYRKASVWAKKTMIVLNSFKKEKRINDNIQLSEREQEVLNDLYHGLSREEMAENRYLSVNTVKKILLSIYSKLDAGNNVDAIRIGLEKKLIK